MSTFTVMIQLGVLGATLLGVHDPSLATPASRGTRADGPPQLAVRYARALAAGQVSEWAKLDVGCLSRKSVPGDPSAQRCWNETLDAHRRLVADEPETGVFGAVGRGVGLGVLAERHRSSVLWREYPPAVFVSPAVVRREEAPVPDIKLAKAWPTRRLALILAPGREPVGLQGTAVDITVSYPDPLRAPLALKPNEVWWTNGTMRQYGPVREVMVRFVVVSGLRAFGYATDAAVLNEALPDAPSIPGTVYGVLAETGRAPAPVSDPDRVRGMFVPDSARWWDAATAHAIVTSALQDVQRARTAQERLRTLTRLLLLDGDNPEVNKHLGDEYYQRFLIEGVRRSAIRARSEVAQSRLAELYWNLQAQTWRQELTAVATGYEPAADALYGAIAALEIAAKDPAAPLELRRRLGAAYRWNNDGEAALRVHERLLTEVPETEDALRGQVLADIAWDRTQWVSWNRRYDHPWLEQAKREAQQALALATSPEEGLAAAEALLLLEALTIPRDLIQLQETARLARQWYDQIPGVEMLWDYLVGNDVVKALVPDGDLVTLVLPPRSPEVREVGIHARPPAQDLLRTWEFDREEAGQVPVSFSAMGIGEAPTTWKIARDPEAPTAPNVLMPTAGCATEECLQLFLADITPFQYPDVTAQIQVSGGTGAGAGLALADRNGARLYAVVFVPATNTIAIHRIDQGRRALIGTAHVKPAKGDWHHLRVQRSNFVNVSLPRLEIYFDGKDVHAVTDDAIGEISQVGPVVQGNAVAKFDSVHVLDMVSNRPLSRPAAY